MFYSVVTLQSPGSCLWELASPGAAIQIENQREKPYISRYDYVYLGVTYAFPIFYRDTVTYKKGLCTLLQNLFKSCSGRQARLNIFNVFYETFSFNEMKLYTLFKAV